MMADRSWLILAIPGWLAGLALGFIIYELGLNTYLMLPVVIQLTGLFFIWGVIVPVLAWKYWE